jgi:hypothetical protein
VRTQVLGVRLFLSAYAPLFAIFALRQHESLQWVVWGAFAAVGVEETWRILHNRSQVGGLPPVDVQEVRDRGGEVAGYLAAYLLPLIGGSIDGWTAAAYGVFFLVLFAIFVQSDLKLLNPMLYCARWRVFGGRIEGVEGETILVARSRPRVGDRVSVVNLEGGWLIK